VTAFWTTLASYLRGGQKVFIALVAEHTTHSPGTTGARMIVAEDGTIAGTIGGGIMEYNLVKRARTLLEDGEFAPELQTLHHREKGEGEKSGMICAGRQTNLYYLCYPERDTDAVEEAARAQGKGLSGEMHISEEGMGFNAGPPVVDQPQILLVQQSGAWRYVEQLLNQKRIAIMGGGHCALALSRMMQGLGYDVFVFDTRSDVATVQQNTFARSVTIVPDLREAGAQVGYPELTDVVVMTTDFPSDVHSLLGVVALPFPFVGMMGSPAKITRIYKELQKAGVSKEALAKIHMPVGLPIHSNTPEEIAISVAAQIIQRRNALFGARDGMMPKAG